MRQTAPRKEGLVLLGQQEFLAREGHVRTWTITDLRDELRNAPVSIHTRPLANVLEGRPARGRVNVFQGEEGPCAMRHAQGVRLGSRATFLTTRTSRRGSSARRPRRPHSWWPFRTFPRRAGGCAARSPRGSALCTRHSSTGSGARKAEHARLSTKG